MTQPVTFLASLPDIQSAIKVGTDSMRVQFDIPETEKANAVPLLALFGVVLRVTIEPLINSKDQQSAKRQALGARAIGKSTWATTEKQNAHDASGEGAIAEP